MASAVASRASRESAPESVEADLSVLWREICRTGPVARAIMANLLVVRRAGAPSTDDQSIEAVAARHPSRVLIIDHETPPGDEEGSFTTAVGIVTFGPPTARYGIERVAVRSTCAEAALPSLVRRYTRGGLPISVWWTEDFSTRPFIDPLVALGRQLVFDSCSWRDVRAGIRALAPWLDRDVIDINWRRLAPLRRALAFAASSSEAGAWGANDVRIVHGPNTALAWLLAGWLASRLDWAADSWPDVEGASNPDTILTIEIGAGAERIAASLEGSRAIVARGEAPSSSIGIAHESDADAIAAELHALSRDVGLQDALRALLNRFG